MFEFLNKDSTHKANKNRKLIHVEADETLLLLLCVKTSKFPIFAELEDVDPANASSRPAGVDLHPNLTRGDADKILDFFT